MTETKKTTTPDTSVGADAVQPLLKNSTNSITDSSNNCNLHTISMTELYDTVYPPRRPIVDNLLYSGTYLFVGAPKIGKSFFMAQLAYTVATGLILWEYEVHQGTVLYLALEDNYARLQRKPTIYTLQHRQNPLSVVWTNSLKNLSRLTPLSG